MGVEPIYTALQAVLTSRARIAPRRRHATLGAVRELIELAPSSDTGCGLLDLCLLTSTLLTPGHAAVVISTWERSFSCRIKRWMRFTPQTPPSNRGSPPAACRQAFFSQPAWHCTAWPTDTGYTC